MLPPLRYLTAIAVLFAAANIPNVRADDPTPSPTPSPAPTQAPAYAPTEPTTAAPTDAPTVAPTTQVPTVGPTDAPTEAATVAPTTAPNAKDDKPKEKVKDAKWYWEHEADERFAAATGNFTAFTPDDETQTCSKDTHATPFTRQVRGANLGGWLVLEPWLTPSLFYQFLSTQERFGDKAPEKTAMDSYSFCTALGAEEANRQLRVHWANWVTEDDIAEMAEHGVNSLRVPVGDWMFTPYEPFIGCTDGAVEELDRVADLALKYNIELLIDMHGLVGSQNGFDNSGHSTAVKWTSIASTKPVGTTTFEHWPIRQAGWAGTYDPEILNYTSINYNNLNQSLTAVENIINRYAKHPAIVGLEPVNEPWELTPIKVLKDYYWKSYKRVKVLAPHWKFVLHDSFRFGLTYWSEFMKGCPDIALDTHIYQAWMNPGTRADFFSNACQQKYTITDMENALMPVIVGEWSLATDNCAMWLNGFNDNLPGFPKVICQLKKCPVQSTYLGQNFPGTPLDITKPIQGPYGTGTSGPSFGLCPANSNLTFGQTKPKDEFDFIKNLNLKKLNAYAVGHGWYFWNFKTELDTRWDFLQLLRLGAFPKNVSDYKNDDGVFDACKKEDNGEFVCKAKRGVKPLELENGLKYACNTDAVDCTDIKKKFLTLEEQCDWAFNEYWQSERLKGATCDFGGAAHLLAIPTSSQPPAAAPQQIIVKSEGGAGTIFGEKTSSLAMIIGGVAIVAVIATVVVRLAQRRRRRNYNPIDRSA